MSEKLSLFLTVSQINEHSPAFSGHVYRKNKRLSNISNVLQESKTACAFLIIFFITHKIQHQTIMINALRTFH